MGMGETFILLCAVNTKRITCKDVEAGEGMRTQTRPQRDVVGLRKQLGREPIPDRE